ncbi:COMM domain-containing protein 4 [Tyrophagus putrescentiae]|nr:COMM domain-containing protein 4 [Tyrophagus putrescentiae]
MKFKFCGDNDCQDWLLAQINLLSKLTSIKVKLILNEVIGNLLTGKELDFAKICKLTADARLSEDETKAAVAALHFIIASASKYDTEGEVLSNELQQLGLPREHSTALCKVYADNVGKVQAALREQSLRLTGGSLKSSSFEIRSKFSSVDSGGFTVDCPAVILKLKTTTTTGEGQERLGQDNSSSSSSSFYVPPEKLDDLIHNLKDALQTMEGLNVG